MISEFIKKFNARGEIYLRIKALPNRPMTEARQVMADQTIKINLAAKAEKGQANRELIRFLAHEFAINKKNVKIIGGAGDRLKLVRLVK